MQLCLTLTHIVLCIYLFFLLSLCFVLYCFVPGGMTFSQYVYKLNRGMTEKPLAFISVFLVGFDIASVRKLMQVGITLSWVWTSYKTVRRWSPNISLSFSCLLSLSLSQFFSMGVSSVFTLFLCGTTTFPMAVAFVSATMGLTTFSHR